MPDGLVTMTVINFIRKFPEISNKDEKYYLYLGMFAGFKAKEILEVIDLCLDQDIFKRKILLNKVMLSAANWTTEENEKIFKKTYLIKDTLSSYYKKESASMVLMALFPHVSQGSQKKLSEFLSQSRYKNNRKRLYRYLYKNWTSNCQIVIEKAWINFKDEEAIGIIVAKMPRSFLLINLKELLSYFDEDSLSYDFFLKILRNKLYTRLYNDIPSKIQELKDNDPISYIFIKKELKEKLDTEWAIKIYKQYPQSRFLARWYSEMNLWQVILREKPDFLSEIKHSE